MSSHWQAVKKALASKGVDLHIVSCRGEVELPDGLFCASALRDAEEVLRAISTELCQGCAQCIAVNILR